MNEIWRNRAILAITTALLVLGAFVVQYYGVYDIKAAIRGRETPFDRLEESGFADILHFGHVQSSWASNKIIHIAAILYPPWPDLSDAYVVIEDNIYSVQRGGYFWEPSTKMLLEQVDVDIRGAEDAAREFEADPEAYAEKLGLSVEEAQLLVAVRIVGWMNKRQEIEDGPIVEEEPLDTKWTHWTMDKFRYYKGHALFPPGRFDLAQEAIKVLVDWQNEERIEQRDRAMREWLYAVIQEACQYTDWDWIEIDVFHIGKEPRPVLIATKSGKPEWAAGYEKTFTHTLFLWRRSPEDSDWTIDKVAEEGELSQETVDWMLETQQLFMQEAFTWYGAVPYQYSFNDEWQGLEIQK